MWCDAPFRQPIVDELEVLARVEIDRPGRAGRRRLTCDQIEPLPGGLEEKPSVLEMQSHARIVQRMRLGAIHDVALSDGVRRELHHVARLKRLDIRDSATRDCYHVAVAQRTTQR